MPSEKATRASRRTDAPRSPSFRSAAEPGRSPRNRTAAGDRGGARAASPTLKGLLYDAEAKDREIEVTRLVISRLHDRRILWIDLPRREPDELDQLAGLFDLDDRTVAFLARPRTTPALDNFGRYLQFACLTAPRCDGSGDAGQAAKASGGRVDFLVGRNWVVTVHNGDVPYLEAFRAQDKGDTETGALTAAALSASLLDWHLGEYFAEVSRIEDEIDAIDEDILASPSEERLLSAILSIRRRSSRLRRTLLAQRSVFYGLGRPDLGGGVDNEASTALTALAARFERAVDEAEHTRDLSVGSFELFTSRSAQQTNELVKALTFFTVIIGTTAAVAGLFGMNFDPPFFNSGSTGFFAVTVGLLVAGLAAWVVGRRRQWI